MEERNVLDTELSQDEMKLVKALQKEPKTVTEIHEMFNIAKEDVFPLIDKLRGKGYQIELEGRSVFLRKEPIPGKKKRLSPVTKSTVKILVLSDLGLGLRSQQGDLLATAYKIGEEEEVYFALITGISAGYPQQKKLGEYFLRSFDEQLDYAQKHIPKASFKTYFINGFNDLTFKTKGGQNFGYTLGNSRDDLRYCGDKEATFIVGKDVRIALVHAGADVSVYTKSYALQGIIENYQEAINYVLDNERSPQIILAGGLFSMLRIPTRLPYSKRTNRDIDGYALPSLYGITPSQRVRKKRGGSPVLGCLILNIEFDKDGSLKKVIPDFRDLTAYQKKDDYLKEIDPESDETLADEQKKILKLLKTRHRTYGDICRNLHRAVPYVKDLVEKLKEKGYIITFDKAEKSLVLERGFKEELRPLDTEQFYAKRAIVADISDTHLGDNSERPDLLKRAYKLADSYKIPAFYSFKKQRGVDVITHSGDVFEGEGAYKGQTRELKRLGADAQRDYALGIWPGSKIPTELIRGSSHEKAFWDNAGHDIVDTFVKMSKRNLHYLGSSAGTFDINGIRFKLVHPSGGIPYGISYRPQNMIEKTITVIEKEAPEKVIKIGHLHVALFMMYKGIAAFLVPCLEDQTEYMKNKGLIPWLGMWITGIYQDKRGNITRVVPEYVPFEPKGN